MLMRRGQRTPTANRVLRLFGGVGVLLVLSILGLAALFLAQPDEPQPLAARGTIMPGAALTTPMTSTAPLPAGERPTAWTVRLATHPATGRPEGVVDDARVARMVRDDYLAGEQWFFSQVVSLTLDAAAESRLEEYFTGPRLNEMLGLVHRFQERGEAYRSELSDRRIEVRNFSADGQQVYLGDAWAGGRVAWYRLASGAIQREQPVPPGLIIVTMRYDPGRFRWRQAAVRVIYVDQAPE